MPYHRGVEQRTTTPLDEATDRVGDRWSLLLVEALLGGARRFGELLQAVPGIAPNILSQRLKRLEQKGVIVSRTYSQRPVRQVYELTADGQDLAGAIRLLADWGARAVPDSDGIRHAACGTQLEAHWYCPTCSEPVAEAEASDLRFV